MPNPPTFGPPYRIVWLDDAKADVRQLDRPRAMRIFEDILRFARTGGGAAIAFASATTVSCSL